MTLKEQCELIASGATTSLALTTKAIERIRARNPELNIVIREQFEQALSRARMLDQQPSGQRGPLHGVPFTLKDAFRVKGTGTSYGLPGLSTVPAFDDCLLVERLFKAGAVLLGQTNVPFSCFDWQTNSPMYGLTKNPRDPALTVGGSSGGSAASVAAAFSAFEIGSDIAGSIRYPAHACGVFGLRPSHGLVPFDDIGPQFAKKTFESLAVAGPIARNIEDLELVLSVVAKSTRAVLPSDAPLQVALTTEWGDLGVDDSSREQIARFVQGARQLGHVVCEHQPRLDLAHAANVWGRLCGYEYKRQVPMMVRWRPFLDFYNYFFNTRRFHDGPFKESFELGFLGGRRGYVQALTEAVELRGSFAREFEGFDVWLTPVSCGAAIAHQKTGDPISLDGTPVRYADYLGHFLASTAVLHHPVLVAPIGEIGLQLHGKFGQDWELLTQAKRLSSLFKPPAVDD